MVYLTERQQVVLAKNLSDPSAATDHRDWFAEQTSASRPHAWAPPENMHDRSFKSHSPQSSASTVEKGDWKLGNSPTQAGTAIVRTTSGGALSSATKPAFKKRRPRFSPKAATVDARKTQKALKEASATLLDISDRVPFTGVRSSGVKIWAKFDRDTRACSSVKELLRQALWFLRQIKDAIKTNAWCSRESQWQEECKHCHKAKDCKVLISELESVAINWAAVARTWATERGLDTAVWPNAWNAAGAPSAGPPQKPRVEKWRAYCETYLQGRWRQLGLTFVLAVPSDMAASGPERHGDEAGVSDVGGAEEWEGVRGVAAWDGRGGVRQSGQGMQSASDEEEDDEDMGDEETWEDEYATCEMQPRSESPYFGSRASDGTLEPVGSGMADGTEDVFSGGPGLEHQCPGVIDDDHDQLLHGLWSGSSWN